MITPALQIFLTRRDILDRLRNTSTTGAEILRKMKRNFTPQEREMVRKIVEETALSDLKSFTRSRSTIDALIKVLSIPYYDNLPVFDSDNNDNINTGLSAFGGSDCTLIVLCRDAGQKDDYGRIASNNNNVNTGGRGIDIGFNDVVATENKSIFFSVNDGLADNEQTVNTTTLVAQSDVFAIAFRWDQSEKTFYGSITKDGVTFEHLSEVYTGAGDNLGPAQDLYLARRYTATGRSGDLQIPNFYADASTFLSQNEIEAIMKKMMSGGQVSFPFDVYPNFDPDNNDGIDLGVGGFGAYDDTWYIDWKQDPKNFTLGGAGINYILANTSGIAGAQGFNFYTNTNREVYLSVMDAAVSGIGQDSTTNIVNDKDHCAAVITADHSTKTVTAWVHNHTQGWTEELSITYAGTHDFDNGTNLFAFKGGSSPNNTRDTNGQIRYVGRIHGAVSEAQADQIIAEMEAGGDVTLGEYNLLPDPNNLLSWDENLNLTVTEGQPDYLGRSTAFRLTDDGTADAHRIQSNSFNVGETDSYYTASCVVKSIDHQWVYITVNGAGPWTGSNLVAYYDIQNGVLGTVGSNLISADITDLGGGFYRLEWTAEADAGIEATKIRIGFSESDGGGSYSGTGTSFTISHILVNQGEGGYNYISNSDDLGDFYSATTSGTTPTVTTGEEDAFSGSDGILVDYAADSDTDFNRVMIQMSPASQGLSTAGDGFMLPNTTYTWSVYAKKGTSNAGLTMLVFDPDGGTQFENKVLTDEWERYDYTFTTGDFDPTSDVCNLQLRVTSDEEQSIRYSHAMINQGTTALDYESGGATVFPFGLNRRALDTDQYLTLADESGYLTTQDVDFDNMSGNLRQTTWVRFVGGTQQWIIGGDASDGSGFGIAVNTGAAVSAVTAPISNLFIDDDEITISSPNPTRDAINTLLSDGNWHKVQFDSNMTGHAVGAQWAFLNFYQPLSPVNWTANLEFGGGSLEDLGGTFAYEYNGLGQCVSGGGSDLVRNGTTTPFTQYYVNDNDGAGIIDYDNTGTIELQTIADNILRDMPDLNRRAVDDYVYSENFNGGVGDWTASGGGTASIDASSGDLEVTLGGGDNVHFTTVILADIGLVVDRLTRMELEVRAPITNSVVTGIEIRNDSSPVLHTEDGINGSEWIPITIEFTPTKANFRIYAYKTGGGTIDANGETFEIRNVQITQFGYADTGDGAGALTLQVTSVDGVLPKVPSDIDLFEIRHPELAA